MPVMSRRLPSHFAVAALSVDLTAGGNAPTEFRLIPLGRFLPAAGSFWADKVPNGWLLTEDRARSIVALRAGMVKQPVIDYEHQTLNAAENGKPAPAAGWIGGLELRADGIYAVDVEWTVRAAQMIADKEYRYISPVFPYDSRTGAVQGFAHAALVNDPGLDGLTDLAGAAALSALFMEDEPMKALLAALGLSETATEAEALAALNAKTAPIQAELAALKAQAPDPARYVEVATLTAVRTELATATTELAALKAEKAQAEVDKVIADGLAAGKLTPATEPHARKLAGDLAALKGFIDAQPVIAKPGATQTGGDKPAGGNGTTLTDTQLAVCKAMGVTPEDYAKTLAAEAVAAA